MFFVLEETLFHAEIHVTLQCHIGLGAAWVMFLVCVVFVICVLM
jgi:hypothetical protein